MSRFYRTHWYSNAPQYIAIVNQEPDQQPVGTIRAVEVEEGKKNWKYPESTCLEELGQQFLNELGIQDAKSAV